MGWSEDSHRYLFAAAYFFVGFFIASFFFAGYVGTGIAYFLNSSNSTGLKLGLYIVSYFNKMPGESTFFPGGQTS